VVDDYLDFPIYGFKGSESNFWIGYFGRVTIESMVDDYEGGKKEY
jgi:hypothetical protein